MLFSQNKVSILVKNETSEPITGAILIVSQNSRQIVFETTNENGKVEIEILNGDYDIKLSKLGYTTTLTKHTISKEINLEFILKEEVNKLENVIITTRPKLMKIKGDTISYNLKSIVDGTENKIEDVVKKLPGLEINSDGKVLYKGSKIDNVLIDGNEFFGNKHQMALQNIDAKMVESIDLLTNYSGFAFLNGSRKGVALNLKTKDSFKKKWITDVELNYGVNNSFRFHSNSFKFSKDGNFTFISDINTIAKTPISREDYKEMNIPLDSDSDSNEFKEIETPSFLNPNILFRDKKNSFFGLNYTNLISKRLKITFSNLFNKSNTLERNNQTQINIGINKNNVSFIDDKTGINYLNNSSFKLEYNKSDNTFMSYQASLTPNTNLDKQDLLKSESQINFKKNYSNINFSQFFKLNTLLFYKINYSFSINHSLVTNQQNLNLRSSEKLFNTESNLIDQLIRASGSNYEITNLFSRTIQNNMFSLRFKMFSTTTNIKNTLIDNAELYNKLNRELQTFQPYLSWLRNWNSKLQTSIAVKASNSKVSLQDNESLFVRIEPIISTQYSFSNFNKFTLTFEQDHQAPSLNQLQNSHLINDFQTVLLPSQVEFSKIIPKSTLSANYLNINPKNYSVIFSSVTLAKEKHTPSINTNYYDSYLENQSINTEESETLRGLFLYDLKLIRFPFSFKTTFAYLHSNGIAKFNNIRSDYFSQNTSSRFQFFSNFKKTFLQFEIDYNFLTNHIEQELNGFINTSITHRMSFVVKNKRNNHYNWDIGFIYDNQNTGFNTNTIFFLNATFQYLINDNIKAVFNGNNMLNLNTTQLISTTFSNSLFTESNISIRPGYLMIGINYSL
jgi:hypothetical protein